MLSREQTATLLREQAEACASFGSPLYSDLLTRAAGDAASGGVVFDLLSGYRAANPRADALALRLMAAVHRLVLTGEALELGAHYPSVGGSAPGAWPAFERVLTAHQHRLGTLIALPCQTNEVGRAAALAFGFFDAALSTALPIRLLEVGASAGLNLRFDHYRYGGGGAAWGRPGSPVDLTGLWAHAPRGLPEAISVAERRGCDPRPVDPATEDGRLSLEASLWADQVERFTRLRGALEIARRVPVMVDRASVESWLPGQLSESRPGLATIIYHSIVEEYLGPSVRRSLRLCLSEAGAAASEDAPIFWLKLEPVTDSTGLRYAVSLTRWPTGAERIVAWSGPHGNEVRRADAPTD